MQLCTYLFLAVVIVSQCTPIMLVMARVEDQLGISTCTRYPGPLLCSTYSGNTLHVLTVHSHPGRLMCSTS